MWTDQWAAIREVGRSTSWGPGEPWKEFGLYFSCGKKPLEVLSILLLWVWWSPAELSAPASVVSCQVWASLTGALGRMRITHLQVYFPLTNPQLFNNKLLCSNGCEWMTLAWLTCLPGLRISDWTSGLLHMSSLWSQPYGSFPGYVLLPVGHSTRGHTRSPQLL